ncbi:MAG: ABC transporter substrate-binding protein, partial [Opitutaceae bacterium]|nr:ABC transporter substrate-binding protein [Opitutaceae bacterium]
ALGLTCAALRAAQPVRVVSQFVGGDEMLIALAEPEQIAALSHLATAKEYSAVAAEAARFPHIAQGDAETILKFNPTLVLMADYSRSELVEAVQRTGVRVIVFNNYATFDDACANLRIVARELGPQAEAKAERVITDYRERVRVLAEKMRDAKKVRVIVPSTYGIMSGTGTSFQDICDHAGAENLAATLGGLHGHQPAPPEQMLAWPVDQVVVSGETIETALAPFLDLSPYKYLTAVRERRVVLVQPYMLSCMTHYRVDGYECLARALHPELF